jgi:hypothetical protein
VYINEPHLGSGEGEAEGKEKEQEEFFLTVLLRINRDNMYTITIMV